MKSKSLFMLAIVTSSIAVFLLVREFYAQSSIIPAFTVQYTERASNYTTGKSVYKTGTYARRADGSTGQVDMHHGPGGEINVTRKIALVPEGQRVVVADAAEVKTTFPWAGASDSLKHISSDSTCGATPDQPVVGYGEFLGVRVVKLVRDTGDRRLETWHAPSLGCYVLWHHIDFRGAGGKVTDFDEWATTSITMGEPSPELFQAPHEYQEVKPSDMELAVRAHFGKECTECANVKWKRQDDLYLRLRQAKSLAQK